MTIRFLKRFKHSLLGLLVLPFIFACNDVSCPLNNTVASVYGFYATARTDDGGFAPGAAITIGDTLTIRALGPDTVLANRLIGKGTVSLPVSFYEDVDVLQFAFYDKNGFKTADTLWISKKNTHHFDDPSCAIHMWHTILGVRSTHHLIDSVMINDPSVNYDGNENFQIYFFTSKPTNADE